MVLWVLTQLLVSRMEAVCKHPFISPVIVAFQIITNFRAFGIQRLNMKFVFCILTYPPLPRVLVIWAYEIEDFWVSEGGLWKPNSFADCQDSPLAVACGHTFISSMHIE